MLFLHPLPLIEYLERLHLVPQRHRAFVIHGSRRFGHPRAERPYQEAGLAFPFQHGAEGFDVLEIFILAYAPYAWRVAVSQMELQARFLGHLRAADPY